MTLIGYMRVSTEDQDTELQRLALLGAGVLEVNIYADTISGTKTSRDGLNAALARMQAGDTLVVWKLDRLGRRVRLLHELVEQLQERGVGFRSLTEAFDTSTTTGRAMFGMMCVFAQMEREMISERTKGGLAVARAAGKRIGRPVVDWYDRADAVAQIREGMRLEDACTRYGFSMSTARRLKRRA